MRRVGAEHPPYGYGTSDERRGDCGKRRERLGGVLGVGGGEGFVHRVSTVLACCGKEFSQLIPGV